MESREKGRISKSFGSRAMPGLSRSILAGIAGSAALLSSHAAWADGATLDIVGDMEVSIDGETRDHVIISGEVGGEAGQSAFIQENELPGGRSFWELNITGYDPDSENILSEDMIAITVSLGSGSEPQLDPDHFFGLEMIWIKENGFRPEVAYVTEGHDLEDAELTIEHFEFDGETGEIRGSATGTACRLSMQDLHAGIDEEDCVPLEAHFESPLAFELMSCDQ